MLNYNLNENVLRMNDRNHSPDHTNVKTRTSTKTKWDSQMEIVSWVVWHLQGMKIKVSVAMLDSTL